MNDLLLCVDRGEAVLVALLDLSAAFDTIDRTIDQSFLIVCLHVLGFLVLLFSGFSHICSVVLSVSV